MKTKHQSHEIIDDVNDAVYTVDLLGKFTSMNPAGERMTGYTSREFQKLHITHVVVPQYMHLVKAMIKQKIEKDIPTVYEIEIRRKDGKNIPVEISSRALHENGKPSGILGIARDISERKALEQQKEMFFSLVTHEIKNPLSSIKVFAGLLQKYHTKTIDEKPKQYALMIDEQVNKLNALVNDFLDISTMNAGKFSLHKHTFDLDELVTDVIKTFNNSLTTQRIHKKGNGTMSVNADRNRIEQVITNLLTNALKYSLPDTPITVSLKKVKKNIVVSIADSGPGIPKENQKNIFELFYRLTPNNDQIKGHGLGLYICKQIIKSHKGEIGVESNEDKGSTFHFSLPTQ